MTPKNLTLTERLNQGEPVTADELHVLRRSLSTLSPDERTQLNTAVDSYAISQREKLAEDVQAESALLALKHTLTEQTPTIAKQIETLGRDAGKIIEETAKTTATNAQILAFEEWKQITHPENTWQTKTLHVLGILSLGYLLYRSALWVKGKPEGSFLGTLFRFAGVAALAGFAINHFGKKVAAQKVEKLQEEEKKEPETPEATPPPAKPSTARSTPRKPVATKTPKPKPAPKPEPEVKSEVSSIIANAPENENLVGKGKIVFVLDGKEHSIECKSDGLFVDGLKYIMTASVAGPDPQLAIMDVRRTGGSVSFKAGAWGREGTVVTDNEELKSIIRALLKNGSYSGATSDGTEITIAKQMY